MVENLLYNGCMILNTAVSVQSPARDDDEIVVKQNTYLDDLDRRSAFAPLCRVGELNEIFASRRTLVIPPLSTLLDGISDLCFEVLGDRGGLLLDEARNPLAFVVNHDRGYTFDVVFVDERSDLRAVRVLLNRVYFDPVLGDPGVRERPAERGQLFATFLTPVAAPDFVYQFFGVFGEDIVGSGLLVSDVNRINLHRFERHYVILHVQCINRADSGCCYRITTGRIGSTGPVDHRCVPQIRIPRSIVALSGIPYLLFRPFVLVDRVNVSLSKRHVTRPEEGVGFLLLDQALEVSLERRPLRFRIEQRRSDRSVGHAHPLLR